MHSLRMVFRDPTDQGDIRKETTPSPDVTFQVPWEDMKYNDKPILSPAALKEIKCLLAHVDRGCLSGIPPGGGTNDYIVRSIPT